MNFSNINKYTWILSNRNLKSIIDYIIIRESNNIKINDMRMFRGTGYHSNHYLLRIFLLYKHSARNSEKEEI